jgi:ABC-type methionine transport system ATPase subunit
MQPNIMLFDEPTSALDMELINEVLDVIIKLSIEGMTMLIVTHEIGFARRIGTRAIFMDKGEIIEAGKPNDLIIKPQKERTRVFMSKILNEKSSLFFIRKNKTVRVGIIDKSPPMCYTDETGKFHGFDTDIAKKITEKLNVNL